MKYLNYRHISEETFLSYKTILNKIESYINNLFVKENFYLNRRAEHEGSLSLNLNTSKEGFSGNICLLFNDKESSPSFDLVVVKTYDINGERKFKRKIVIAGINIEEVEKNYKKYFLEAIKIYDSISKDELTDSVL